MCAKRAASPRMLKQKAYEEAGTMQWTLGDRQCLSPVISFRLPGELSQPDLGLCKKPDAKQKVCSPLANGDCLAVREATGQCVSV